MSMSLAAPGAEPPLGERATFASLSTATGRSEALAHHVAKRQVAERMFGRAGRAAPLVDPRGQAEPTA